MHFFAKIFGHVRKKQYLCTRFRKGSKHTNGAVVQLVRIHACHAWGRGFESRPHRKKKQKCFFFFHDSFLFLLVLLATATSATSSTSSPPPIKHHKGCNHLQPLWYLYTVGATRRPPNTKQSPRCST